jgi:hypothetical protein
MARSAEVMDIGGLLDYQFHASILWWVGIGIVAIVLLGRTGSS